MQQYIENNYKEIEEIDYEKFCRMAKKYPKMFSKYIQTEYGTPFDILNMTATGGTYAIELKSRKNKYSDCYIEMEKFTRLRNLWRERYVLPVYICFYENEVYMWLLNEVSNVKIYLNAVVKPMKDDEYECERIGLDFSEAIHMDLDGNILERPKNSTKSRRLPAYKDPEIMGTIINRYNWNRI